MRVSEVSVRAARQTDSPHASALLYDSATGMYDRFTGGRERALRLLERAFEQAGTNVSYDVVSLAELDGQVAGALAAFPVDESPARGRELLGLALRTVPPWRWPGALRLYWAGARAAPSPPGSALYIDALATAPALRRRGSARALLAHAERQARELRLPAVALDTTLDNHAARALYLSDGFEEVAFRPPARGLPGFVALVKELR